MEQFRIATVGIEAKDLTVLKSLINLVTGSKGASWQHVEDPAQAQVAFLGHLPKARIDALVAELTPRVLLVYCCSRGEAPPEGVEVIGHCPPRASELSQILTRVRPAAAPPAPASEPPPAVEIFEPDRCLAGAIHALLPRLLIDQPLLVAAPDAPPLLLDIHAGVRSAHADPSWFTRQDPWRVDVAACLLSTDGSAAKLAECRRYPAHPYPAVRFWGILGASAGRPSREIARAAALGLKRPPDFKTLPHLDWHPRLAGAMLDQRESVAHWSVVADRPVGEVIDFLNACAAVGLVRT
ncbi:MAG: hypothetical protein OHM77_05770 [Candidatus Nitricoxidivorans perseverans]|uniref:Uncharacterized protein n=1 Tax=Candidatus Nitricoxidivorans perseverans TaxID=2975601 RepID=A0AA49FMH4_9PROT|nr:MAG: hypothetical protein OHM77_05770 [Candidatus Nitricoxidivorans perseverans]